MGPPELSVARPPAISQAVSEPPANISRDSIEQQRNAVRRPNPADCVTQLSRHPLKQERRQRQMRMLDERGVWSGSGRARRLSGGPNTARSDNRA